MMVELARELKKQSPVHLGRIAEITGVSENYLAQLAIALRNNGLLVGVSGKRGGYHLARAPEQIKLTEVVEAVIGPLHLTDCVSDPTICLNSSFCEARLIWAILSGSMVEVLEQHTLADLLDKKRVAAMQQDYAHLPLMEVDRLTATDDEGRGSGCPVKSNE
jgi:Rrf2 family protein